jgi:hypothetical protein
MPSWFADMRECITAALAAAPDPSPPKAAAKSNRHISEMDHD